MFGFAIVSKHRDDETGLLEDYYDTGYEHEGEWYQDHIPESTMLKAALGYADSARVAADMHKSAAASALAEAAEAITDPEVRDAAKALLKAAKPGGPPPLLSENKPGGVAKVQQRGDVPFIFPLTSDMCEKLGIVSENTGLLIGMRPDDALRAEFETGNYTGFSIGGRRVRDRLVE